MHPTLIKIGSLQIYSYGLFLFLSFLIGTKLVEVRAKKFGVSSESITNLALIVLISVIVGARLLYVIFHWSEFANDVIGIVAFWRGGLGGLMFFGGFIFAMIAGILYVRHKKMPVYKMFDAIAPALVLGEGLTRIGCFLNGCCFGKPTDSCLGMIFSRHSAAGYTFHVPIHPTQLYSSLAGFVLFVMALILEKKHLKDGVLFGIILIFYSLFRFGIDFIRYYEDSANFWVNQIIAIGFFVLALAFTIIRIKSRPKTENIA
ncbi:MAG: prolipoprotein diacylglyceryl transferase [Candidatus Latescibacteria bacterium]|nr:prolipoprotein diacylglyceryl transferase [Candidatus Latescibacterota bacterium]